MMFPKGLVATGLGMALLVGLGAIPLAAQDNPSPKKNGKAGAPPTSKASGMRRLPTYFGQVGLSPDQRESVYKILAKHQEKIAALEQQLADARTTMMQECEKVLSDAQKQLLEQRRSDTKESRAKARSTAVSKKASTPN
jgi:hypothetical protein